MSAFCRYHCRACSSHFSSLEAFDQHRGGPMDDRHCEFPDDADLVELQGVCRISEFDDETAQPITVMGTIYSTERATQAADYFRGLEGRQTAPVGRKSASGAAS
jgi:hypothetical protein